MAKKKIDVMITAFRDGFQSVYGARVFMNDFMPAVKATADAGIEHFEAGGGAMFQSPYFYANEDSFVMMDKFREAAGPKANLQTLARGINVVCLDSQPRDIIKLHAQLFKKHGMTTIRNFDALNDVNNLIYSGQCIHEAGLKHEVVVTMMSLPPDTPGADKAHTPEFYINTLKNILNAGIPYDSVCFKDASGTSTPKTIFETIKGARALLGEKTPIRFHSHDTAGTCVACYTAAIDAGANGLDLSMAPVSGGTCQSDVISMWHALRGTDYDLGINIDKMREAEEIFKECMKDYFMPPEAKEVEPLIPFSPMPGGALTANTQMMRDNNIMNRYPEVIKAMGEVVELGGFGTSVTPVSQFYFQQAFNNVMFGPWKKIAEGYGKMVLGYFGKTPVAPDKEVVRIAAEQLKLEPTTESPLAINDRNPNKGIPAAKKLLSEAGLPDTDENIFIAASCAEKGIAFLKGNGLIGVRKSSGEKKEDHHQHHAAPLVSDDYNIVLNGRSYHVKIDGFNAIVDGQGYKFEANAGGGAPAEPVVTSSGAGAAITSPLPGIVLRILKKVGDSVITGETVMVMESMKMETPINSPISGRVTSINVEPQQQINTGAVVATVK